MSTPVIVLCTCGNAAEAETIAHSLVEERLAACVNIVPQITSVYRWQERVETTQEHLLLIKTIAEKEEELQKRLLQLHSYDTPEVIVLPLKSGLEKYMVWLRDQII